MNLEALKYPVGQYNYLQADKEVINKWITNIEALPQKLKKLVGNLSYEELELQYRPDGWNIKQVVHHLADSHMNSFIRFKLIQTEDNPTIKPYDEAEWAKTEDGSNEDISDSLDLLEGLHKRWSIFLKSREEKDWQKVYTHPEYRAQKTMEWMLGMYDWHCRHHLAHIKQAIEKEGIFE
ncbi:MAG: putative metal-dependent hydrolase [Ekhidna sp.]|nr:putative metal-dependent hydrolase [Ekhidna sp.]